LFAFLSLPCMLHVPSIPSFEIYLSLQYQINDTNYLLWEIEDWDVKFESRSGPVSRRVALWGCRTYDRTIPSPRVLTSFYRFLINYQSENAKGPNHEKLSRKSVQKAPH
jgi:hypothetical protein